MMLAFILNSIHSTDVGSDRLQAALFMSLYPPLIIILPTLSLTVIMTMTAIILACQLCLCALWLHQVHADLTPCSPPAGDPACVCEHNKRTIDLRTIALNDGSPRQDNNCSYK